MAAKEGERFHHAKCASWRRGLSAQADAFARAKAEEKNRPAPLEMTGGGGGFGGGAESTGWKESVWQVQNEFLSG
jgi:hypothetical protein